ncbi:MAG: hypothetical protein DYG88_07300 [Chloroflexi bacterium CFX4]|nr:hypothetical protein [Chloroflexi bacterium CFX4]MDL1921980.1 hypothetical protein [Chloroflexi bacterium CFX3]
MYVPSNLLEVVVQFVSAFGGMFLLVVAASTVWFTILKVLHHYKQKVHKAAQKVQQERVK